MTKLETKDRSYFFLLTARKADIWKTINKLGKSTF